MSPVAMVVVIAWLPITLLIFSRFPPRTAVILSFIGGLLFLPQGAGFLVPLLPDYKGMLVTCYGIFLGILLFDNQKLFQFRPSWLDLPMFIWSICHVFSSFTNDLGWYDGINQSLGQTMTWGFPYFMGRLYFNNLTGLRVLSINIIKGALLYVPLCLYEVRMSPQLHRMVYGYSQHQFAQTIRYGGFRPMVFMQHGLMVGMWMMTATLVAFWLWRANTVKKIWGIPLTWIVVILTVTLILIKSSGAYGYFVYGLVILFAARWLKTGLPLFLLAIGISIYLYLNVMGAFDGDSLVTWARDIFGTDRAGSLEFRWENETLLAQKAREKLLFGWGGGGRNRIFQENWEGDLEDVSVTDSLWIIAFGMNGLMGLISVTASLLLPSLVFCLWKYPARMWFHPKVAPAAALAVVVPLFMWDCLLNYMFNPIFPLISGGIVGLISQPSAKLSKRPSRPKKRRPTLTENRQTS